MPFSSNNADTGLNLQDTYLKRSNGSGASAEWRAAAGLTDAALASGAFKAKLPQAKFSGLEDKTPFDTFAPMEIVATQASVKAMRSRHPGPLLFFPTDRKDQIRMNDDIPQAWADAGPSTTLSGTAEPGESYSLQVGIWSAANVTANASDVSCKSHDHCWHLGCILPRRQQQSCGQGLR